MTLCRATNSRFMSIQWSCFCFCCFPQGFGLWLGLPLVGVLAVASVLGKFFWQLCLAASEKSLWQETASVLANLFGGGVSGVCMR
ncbi:MAG: hypothetical protein V8Q32_05285 [Anaerotignum faecicola]